MRAKRILTYFGAWLAATTAAGTLTWLGVRDVMHDTVLERPRPLPVSDGDSGRTSQPTAEPDPARTPTEQPRTAEPDPTEPGPGAADLRAEPPGAAESPEQHEQLRPDIRNQDVPGGRAVLSVRPDAVELVSAVPQPGYGVRTWEAPGWLRVEFRRGEESHSVIATWHDHPPRISAQPG